jgi:hypothetical protein
VRRNAVCPDSARAIIHGVTARTQPGIVDFRSKRIVRCGAWLWLPFRGPNVLSETWFPQQREENSHEYAGLDLSLKERSIPLRQIRKRIWRGKCLPDPQLDAELIKQAPGAVWAAFETGPLAPWFIANSPPTVSRQQASTQDMRRRHSTAPNTTGAKDAGGPFSSRFKREAVGLCWSYRERQNHQTEGR